MKNQDLSHIIHIDSIRHQLMDSDLESNASDDEYQVGYPKDNVLNLGDLDYTCHVCLSVLRDPVSIECGHSFCKSCIEKSMEISKRCPTCRKDIREAPRPILVLKNHINLLKINCENDCKWEGKIEKYDEHLKTCTKSTKTPCPRCHKSIVNDILTKHILVDCPYREEACHLCGMMVEHNIMKIHQRVECKHRLIDCEACGIPTMCSILDEHKRLRCIRRPIACIYCHLQHPFMDIDRHQSMCLMRNVTCTQCHEEVRFDKLPEHKAECLHRLMKQQQTLIKMDYNIPCAYCKTEFRDDVLKYHMMICSKKRVPCTRCNKMFEQVQLQDHQKICTYGTIMCHFCCNRFSRDIIADHYGKCLRNPDLGYISPRLFQTRVRVTIGMKN